MIVGLGYLTKNSFFLLPLRLENQSKFHYFPVAKTTSPPTFPSLPLTSVQIGYKHRQHPIPTALQHDDRFWSQKMNPLLKNSLLLFSPPLLISTYQYTSATSSKKVRIASYLETEANRIKEVDDVYDSISNYVKPGDLVVFDRKCSQCSTPLSAISCAVKKWGRGGWDHVGVIVENPFIVKGDGERKPPPPKEEPLLPTTKYSPYLLEFTSSQGISCRPLLERIKISSSKSISVLPISAPGERRAEFQGGSEEDEEDDEDTDKFMSALDKNKLRLAKKNKAELAERLKTEAVNILTTNEKLGVGTVSNTLQVSIAMSPLLKLLPSLSASLIRSLYSW